MVPHEALNAKSVFASDLRGSIEFFAESLQLHPNHTYAENQAFGIGQHRVVNIQMILVAILILLLILM